MIYCLFGHLSGSVSMCRDSDPVWTKRKQSRLKVLKHQIFFYSNLRLAVLLRTQIERTAAWLAWPVCSSSIFMPNNFKTQDFDCKVSRIYPVQTKDKLKDLLCAPAAEALQFHCTSGQAPATIVVPHFWSVSVQIFHRAASSVWSIQTQARCPSEWSSCVVLGMQELLTREYYCVTNSVSCWRWWTMRAYHIWPPLTHAFCRQFLAWPYWEVSSGCLW